MSEDETPDDPDRAAILARRRRFVALALSSLASSGCKSPGPQACLDIAVPNEDEGGEEGANAGGSDETEPSGLDGPIVEDPGQPVEPGTESGDASEGGEIIEPSPQPCLEFAVPPKPAPKPCLKKVAPKPKVSPKVCLFMSD